jgi:O-antigen ligase
MLVAVFIVLSLHYGFRLPSEVFFYSAWAVWAIVTGSFVSQNGDEFFAGVKTVIQMTGMILAVCSISIIIKSIKPVLWGIIVGDLILLMISYENGDFGVMQLTGTEGAERVTSITQNANAFGIALLVGVFTLTYLTMISRNIVIKLVYIFGIVLLSIGIIYSASRKSFIALCIFYFVYFIYYYRNQIFRRPIIIVMLIIMCLMSYQGINYILDNTYLGQRLLKADKELNSSGTRWTMYERGFMLISEYPISGVGLNNYSKMSGLQSYSHSDSIEVTSSTGIIGAILYFMYYPLIWRRMERVKKKSDKFKLKEDLSLCRAAIITLLFIGFGGPLMFLKTVWLFMTCLVAYYYTIENNGRYVKTTERST